MSRRATTAPVHESVGCAPAPAAASAWKRSTERAPRDASQSCSAKKKAPASATRST